MKSTSENTQTEDRASAHEMQEKTTVNSLDFSDNRERTSIQRKLVAGMQSVPAVQMKKDKAEFVFDDKNKPERTTATKVIKQKSGPKGLFKFNYVNGNCINSFQGGNIAKKETAEDTDYADLGTPEITVAVSSHDLAAGDKGLSENDITNGGRAKHFAQADEATGNSAESRKDKYTWHHLQSKGKMELIDMNVHGAMWHYGGIAGWKGSTHDEGDSDDDASGD